MASDGSSPHFSSLCLALPAPQLSRRHHAMSLLGPSFHDPRTHHVLESHPEQVALLSRRDDERWHAIGSHSLLALCLYYPSSSCRFWVLDHLCSNLSQSFTPFPFLAPWPSRPPAIETPPRSVPARPLISWPRNASCSRMPPRASRASLPPPRWATTHHRLSLRPGTAPPSCSLQPLLKLSLLSLRPSLLQFVSIVSPLLNRGNPIFEPVCVFYLLLFCLYFSDRNEIQL